MYGLLVGHNMKYEDVMLVFGKLMFEGHLSLCSDIDRLHY